MIQRIQTVYLGMATVMFIVVASTILRSTVSGFEGVFVGASSGAGLVALMAFASVFLYGRRAVQRNVTVGARALGVAVLAVELYAYFDAYPLDALIKREADSLAVAVLATLVGLALLNLAARAIRRDILLIKSMDRIR